MFLFKKPNLPKLYKGIKYFLAFVALVSIILFALAESASHGAAYLFNQEMAKQKLLRGTITVDAISANALGRVTFENLIWEDPDGNVILAVPEGSFKVSPWDVIRRQFKSTTVQELTLTDATMAVHFDKNMQLDFIKPGDKDKTSDLLNASEVVQQAEGNISLPPSEILDKATQQLINQFSGDEDTSRDARTLREKAAIQAAVNSPAEIAELQKEKEKEKAQEKAGKKSQGEGQSSNNGDSSEVSKRHNANFRKSDIEKRLHNFNWDGQKLNLKIQLDHCQVEVYQNRRHYVMTDVNTNILLNTDKELKIDFSSGHFAGTAIGNGISLNGTIDLHDVKHRIPTLDMDIDFKDVDPSSLGFGDNIHDKMTLLTHAQGEISHPIALGHVEMPKLRIPALVFTDVKGDVKYEMGQLTFTNVTADVYNGKLDAYGDYNIDTRVYNIYGHGTKLDSRIPSKKMEFQTLVDLYVTMKSNGNPHDLWVYGTFQSGEGHYSIIPFNSISGEVNNYHKETDIYNVVIKTDVGDITTDAFHISKGKLQLGTIQVQLSNGQVIYVSADGLKKRKMNWKELQQNVKALQDNVKGIQNNTKALKSDSAGMSDAIAGTSEILKGMEDKVDDIKKRFDHIGDVLSE